MTDTSSRQAGLAEPQAVRPGPDPAEVIGVLAWAWAHGWTVAPPAPGVLAVVPGGAPVARVQVEPVRVVPASVEVLPAPARQLVPARPVAPPPAYVEPAAEPRWWWPSWWQVAGGVAALAVVAALVRVVVLVVVLIEMAIVWVVAYWVPIVVGLAVLVLVLLVLGGGARCAGLHCGGCRG